MQPAFHDAFVLTGPTASGKTALALELAPRLNAEIIAMDSMTLYRGMDIGTAKPTHEEQSRVPHHLIDVLDITESANVAWWLREAERICGELRERGKKALFVGGTPFYLKALRHGVFEAPAIPADIRADLERELASGGPAVLHAELVKVDPESAARLHPNDVQRVGRALEVFRATGIPLSIRQGQGWFAGNPKPPPSDRIIILDMDRDELYRRIDVRVEAMIASGWIYEVRELQRRFPVWGREASQAVGYRLLAEHLEGGIDLQSAVELIQIKTRQFAKHQLTWFRNGGFGRTCLAADVFVALRPFLA